MVCVSKMIQPVLKLTPYEAHRRSAEPWQMSKAFSSLSFRGKRGYSTNVVKYAEDKLFKKTSNPEDCGKRPFRAATYGGILCIKNDKGDNLYALVQGRYTGKWSFPKGHSNEGENPFECTLREVYEETGIEKLPDPIDYLQIGYGNYFVFKLTDKVQLIPRDINEIMDTKWVTLEEMERMSLNADASLYRKRLQGITEL